MRRAALFDLDETLLDRTASLKEFVQWQAAQLLIVDDRERFSERFIELDQSGKVWKDVVYQVLIDEFDLSPWSVPQLLKVYLNDFCRFCKARSGASELIDQFLSKGYKIGVVTNGKTPFQENNLNALEFSALIECVVVSEAVDMRKPERAIFELACRQLNAEIGASVFIGDNPIADIKGAKQAGMQTIYVPKDADDELCVYADFTSNDLHQVLAFVDRL